MNHQTKSDTPETKEAWKAVSRTPDGMFDSRVPISAFAYAMADHSKKMERERDQWVAKAAELSAERESNAMQALAYKAERDELRRWTSVNGVTELERERDELREALNDWENAAKHVESDHPDEVHCGCVPILRKLLESSKRARASLSEACDHLQRERDYLREALSACMEDSIELLSERGWWKNESRSGYAERYAQTAENVIEAQALLATLQK